MKPRAETPAQPLAPIPPPAPVWSVTGVLQGETDKVAILRNGEARQIVRTGDFVDGLYRVIDVTRTDVVLRHGATFYHLTLGAASTAPTGTAPAPAALKPATPNRVIPMAPKDTAFGPVRQPRRPLLSLAHASRSFIHMASSYIAHAAKTPVAPGHIRIPDSSHIAMRFLDNQTRTTVTKDANTRLAMGMAQEMDNSDASDKAKRLLYRNP